MDFRRVALFFALSMLCILAYTRVVELLYGPQERRVAEQDLGESPVAATPTRPTPTARADDVAEPVVPAVPPRPALEGRSVVVESDLFRSEWTTAGARLKSLTLKKYRTDIAPDSPDLELVEALPGQELPVGLEVPALQLDDGGLLYEVDRTNLTVSGDATGSVVFRAVGKGGVKIEKEVRIRGDAYPIGVVARVRANGSTAVDTAVIRLTHAVREAGSSGGGWFGGRAPANGVIALNGRRLEQEPFARLSEESFVFDEAKWAGFGRQYFVSVGLDDATDSTRMVAEQRPPEDPAVVRIELPMAGSPAEASLLLYFGPRDLDILEDSAPSLARAIDFGWFWFVALPLLRLLKASHSITGNYGVDIILVSTLIKVVFLPLTQKSMASMQAMQKLQPQMAKLRERYKDDAQRLQKEMMELYRRHRVNPLSGCLPMLLQIPVFIGLYNALLSAIELRHAPFVMWVTDLSAPERLHIGGVAVPLLAIAMGASMLVQQWMTPATGDPTQRRMMMIMPVMFTFMFINFPSGLVLYWLVNNLLTILQQYFLVNRTAG